MSHETTYDPDTKILETKLSGIIIPQEIEEVISNNVELAIENECYLWLIDYTEADENLKIADMLGFRSRTDKATMAIGNKKHEVKRALVVKEKNEKFKLAELFAATNGHSLMVFTTIKEARTWLLTS